jgi:hypothetical protein
VIAIISLTFNPLAIYSFVAKDLLAVCDETNSYLGFFITICSKAGELGNTDAYDLIKKNCK